MVRKSHAVPWGIFPSRSLEEEEVIAMLGQYSCHSLL